MLRSRVKLMTDFANIHEQGMELVFDHVGAKVGVVVMMYRTVAGATRDRHET